MRVCIDIDIGGEAFRDRLTPELQQILHASDILNRLWDNPQIELIDSNQEICGFAKLVKRKRTEPKP